MARLESSGRVLVYTEIMNNPKMDVDFITLTYKDNEALDKNIIKSIESRKGNEQWWRVYGLGLLGEVEGRIYTDWAITDKVTHNARLWRYGMDFGYSNDPTAIIAIYYLMFSWLYLLIHAISSCCFRF